MITFKEFITEVFANEPHGGKVTATADDFTVVKKISDRVILFSAIEDGGDWQISFEDEDGAVEMTGKGVAVQVVSFIIACTRDFIKRYNPPYIVFNADSNEESRVSLYRQLIKRFGIDYTTTESQFKGDHVFLMTRKTK